MLWTRIRDGVLARVREGGRQVALAIVEALRDRAEAGRVFVVVGSWRQVFGALGLPWPCAKSAIRALALVAQLAGGAVRRLDASGRPSATGHTWQVATVDPQLDLDLERDRKPESGPEGPVPAPQPAAPATRTPARTLALDLAQRTLVAAELAARVTATGALQRGEAWAVTLTVAEGGDAAAVAVEFGRELAAAGGGAVLVPEVAAQLHAHGVAVGTAEQVDAALRACGAGHSVVSPIGDLRRWAGYCVKRWNGEELTSGVLEGSGDEGGSGDGSGGAEGAGGDRASRGAGGAGGATHEQGLGGGGAGERPARGALGGRVREGLRRAVLSAWRWMTGTGR